jgi:uncharacterized protein (TIGR02145 family)
MRYLLTSLLCFFTLSLTAQEAGCTYQQADNFSPTATVDDGTCVFFCSWQPDSNSDGNVGASDLLDFLSVFGDSDSDGDGVYDTIDDCIDLSACNYQSNPTEVCIYLDAIGVCGGGCESDSDNNGICDCDGSWVAHEGYDYSLVQIGEQCWFAENCRYLPEVFPSSEYSVTEPYHYVYGYEGTDVAAAQATANYETYGVLYNWPAVMTEAICPSGWHIPSDGEFTQLTVFLGGGIVAGGKMKDDVQWDGSNSSGFTGLPGGQNEVTSFDYIGFFGKWWSTSESNESESWYRRVTTGHEEVERLPHTRHYGYSARCLQD